MLFVVIMLIFSFSELVWVVFVRFGVDLVNQFFYVIHPSAVVFL